MDSNGKDLHSNDLEIDENTGQRNSEDSSMLSEFAFLESKIMSSLDSISDRVSCLKKPTPLAATESCRTKSLPSIPWADRDDKENGIEHLPSPNLETDNIDEIANSGRKDNVHLPQPDTISLIEENTTLVAQAFGKWLTNKARKRIRNSFPLAW